MIFQPNLILNVFEPTTDRARYGTPLPCTAHYIGRYKFPVTTSGNSCVFLAHYSRRDEPFSGPVKKLTFNQLGSCEPPNLSPYTNTCEIVEFNGYINTASTVFEVVHQLPKVTKVDIFVGSAQQPCFMNDFQKHFSKTPVCPRVKTLKIVVDLEYFHSFQHDCNGDRSQCSSTGKCLSRIQHSFVFLVESLLKHAGDSFPNLKSLIVDLPENDILYKAVQSLIKVSPGLRKRTQTSFQTVLPEENDVESYSRDDKNENFHSLPSWFPNINETRNSQMMHNFMASSTRHFPLRPIPENMFSDQETVSPSSEGYPNDLPPPPQGVQIINHRPPPGFTPLQAADGPQEVIQESHSRHLGLQETDVRQRVSNWLSNLDK